jgi:hypothetical protein
MYEWVAQEITKKVAPWLWEKLNPKAKSQALFFSSEREVGRWELDEFVSDIETAVSYANSSNLDAIKFSSERGRSDFEYEINAVDNCVRGLRRFLRWSESRHYDELSLQLAELRKLLAAMLREVRLPNELTIDMGARKFRTKLKPYFLELRARDPQGALISNQSDEEAWLGLRKTGLTSTDAGRLIRLNGEKRTGWRDLFETKLPGYEPDFFDSYSLGVEREPKIAEWVREEFLEEDFVHNEFIFLSSENQRLMTTPDMVGDFGVCEIKVSSADLKTNLRRYRDQIQWHMMVLGAPACLFVVENRYDQSKEFTWVDADNRRISALSAAAEEWLDDFAEWLDDCDTF